jgi:hypothetical protein
MNASDAAGLHERIKHTWQRLRAESHGLDWGNHPVENAEDFSPAHAERHGALHGLGDRRGPVGAACRDRTQAGEVEEMATQEQKLVQALGGGAGSTHLMCPHCGKRVDLTYRSSYELALDLAVREPPPDEEARPGDGDKS